MSSKEDKDGDGTMVSGTAGAGPYLATVNVSSVFTRLYYWAQCEPSGYTISKENLHKVQYALIFEQGTKLTRAYGPTTTTYNTRHEREQQMLTGYKDLVKRLVADKKIDHDGLSFLKTLKGAQTKSDCGYWPSGNALYRKYNQIKSQMIKILLPHRPQSLTDKNDIPSGRDLLEYIAEWKMIIYANEMAIKSTKKKKDGQDRKSVEQILDELNHKPTNVPGHFFDKDMFPQNVMMACIVHMYHAPALMLSQDRPTQKSIPSRADIPVRQEEKKRHTSNDDNERKITKKALLEQTQAAELKKLEVKAKKETASALAVGGLVNCIKVFDEIGSKYMTPAEFQTTMSGLLTKLKDSMDPNSTSSASGDNASEAHDSALYSTVGSSGCVLDDIGQDSNGTNLDDALPSP